MIQVKKVTLEEMVEMAPWGCLDLLEMMEKKETKVRLNDINWVIN